MRRFLTSIFAILLISAFNFNCTFAQNSKSTIKQKLENQISEIKQASENIISDAATLIKIKDDNSQILSDVVYKSVGKDSIKLDIYYPYSHIIGQSENNSYPVVVYIHGGSWRKGSKKGLDRYYRSDILDSLRKSNIAVISIDYRLVNDSIHFPIPIVDTKDAVRWISKNAKKYQLDSKRIALWGTSAGGHLALMAAYTQNGRYVGDSDLANYPCNVTMVIDNYSPVDMKSLFGLDGSREELVKSYKTILPKKYKSLMVDFSQMLGLSEDFLNNPDKFDDLIATCDIYSPATIIASSAKKIPVIIFHGKNDKIVPYEQALLLKRTLRRQSVDAPMHIYSVADHGFATLLPKVRTDVVNNTISFVYQYFKID